MLAVDKSRYSWSDMRRLGELQLANQAELQHPAELCIALCIEHPFELVSLVLQLQEEGGTVLLLPQHTPLVTAKQRAIQAGCRALIYGRADNLIILESDACEARESGMLQYSSGTTGEPKLIHRSWTDIELEIAAYNERLAAEPGEQPIIWVPVTHSFGLIAGVLASLRRGAEPIVLTEKNPRFWHKMLKEHPRSIVYAVPFLLHLYLSFKLPTKFHRVVSSGSSLTDSLLEQIRELAGEVIQQYGCTELGCISLSRHPQASTDVGKPLSHMRLAEPGTKEQPEEWIVTYGSRETATHDLGYRDEQGRLHLLGRTDDLINVSGQKVIPLEVEQVLLQHAQVAEAVVCRSPHKVWGEAVKAWIVPRDHADEDELRQWCVDRLPPYKVPSFIEQVTTLPRNANGKIDRRQLERAFTT